ncbi:contact-dependent growth inhibition system immunity protein [Mycobacterium sp. DBP42]|uniref:contact-dependent growth inhibition system immunity protein n=1 Tax=Mycobacterium sp. DBP42 TaxID=2545267 RepID=UPI00110CD625|nr:contact-dependent growth inhibition system immunity protein [Mycobacterium sp. DBP42]TMS53651.1 hypothetical protein E0T84_09985 [Mycobacterium sp. DBP42]
MNDGSISADLHRFFAAYFHQDWDLEADDWEGIVDTYATDHPSAELLRKLADEIDGLCEVRPEADLEQFLVYTVGVYYVPEPLTYKAWLGQVANRLRERAAAIDNRSTA